MIIDTDNYDAQELQMFFNELSKRLKTKQQYSKSNAISPEGVRKRLKSVLSPQVHMLCGITLIVNNVDNIDVEEKLLFKKATKYF